MIEGYVLRRRLYRDTSVLLELWTRTEGRLSAIARGVRRNKSKQAGLLQSFVPLWLDMHGKGELALLKNVEPRPPLWLLSGRHYYSGFYLNELLLKTLARGDVHAGLFTMYEECLRDLQSHQKEERILRRFETGLLREIGYGIDYCEAGDLSLPLKPELFYRWEPERGFMPVAQGFDLSRHYRGCDLLAASQGSSELSVLHMQKRLHRQILQTILGGRSIAARDFFAEVV